MNTWQAKAALVCAGIAVFSFTMALGIRVGEGNSVDTWNDGFATSKQDDCQQGFQLACEWLKGTR